MWAHHLQDADDHSEEEHSDPCNPYTLLPTHSTRYTLHPTPYTLHPTPYTLHPSHSTLYTLNSAPYTPYTLHLTPYTLHSPNRTICKTPTSTTRKSAVLTFNTLPRCPLANSRSRPLGQSRDLISQKVLIRAFCTSQVPHKSVNLSFAITDMKNKLTDLCCRVVAPSARRPQGERGRAP